MDKLLSELNGYAVKSEGYVVEIGIVISRVWRKCYDWGDA